MKAQKDLLQSAMKVDCSFSNHLNMPKICSVCGSAASEKYQVVGYTKSRLGRLIINFPICSNCLNVKNEFINGPLIIGLGILAILFSVFTTLNQPAYLKIPKMWHIILGILWIIILVGFLLFVFHKYRTYVKAGNLLTKSRIDSAVTIENLILPTKKAKGAVTFLFTNHSFGRLFKKLNNLCD